MLDYLLVLFIRLNLARVHRKILECTLDPLFGLYNFGAFAD